MALVSIEEHHASIKRMDSRAFPFLDLFNYNLIPLQTQTSQVGIIKMLKMNFFPYPSSKPQHSYICFQYQSKRSNHKSSSSSCYGFNLNLMPKYM